MSRDASFWRNVALIALAHLAVVLALARAYASGIPVADLPLMGNTSGPVPPPSGFFRVARRS
jgi:hypothetical protein